MHRLWQTLASNSAHLSSLSSSSSVAVAAAAHHWLPMMMTIGFQVGSIAMVSLIVFRHAQKRLTIADSLSSHRVAAHWPEKSLFVVTVQVRFYGEVRQCSAADNNWKLSPKLPSHLSNFILGLLKFISTITAIIVIRFSRVGSLVGQLSSVICSISSDLVWLNDDIGCEFCPTGNLTSYSILRWCDAQRRYHVIQRSIVMVYCCLTIATIRAGLNPEVD